MLFVSGWTGPADGGHLSTSCPCAACIYGHSGHTIAGIRGQPRGALLMVDRTEAWTLGPEHWDQNAGTLLDLVHRIPLQ